MASRIPSPLYRSGPLTEGFFCDARLPALPAHQTQRYKNRDLVKYALSFIDPTTYKVLMLVNRRWSRVVGPLNNLPHLASEDYIPMDAENHCRIMRSFHRKHIKMISETTGLEISLSPGERDVSLPNLVKGAFGEFCVGQIVGKRDRWIGIKITRGESAVEAEVMVQRALRSKPHILTALATHMAISPTGHPSLYQFMELAGLGSADKLIPLLPILDHLFKEKVLFLLAQGLCEGLNEMHDAGFCHLDIKPSNFAMRQNGAVYLIDFGCSASMHRGQLDIKKEDGDMNYYAPERWLAERIPSKQRCAGAKVDAWAAGLSLLELLGYDIKKLLARLRSISALPDAERALARYVHEQLDTVVLLRSPSPDSYADLILKLLNPNPKERISPGAALRHPWYRKMLTSTTPIRDIIVGYLRESLQSQQHEETLKRWGSLPPSPQALPSPYLTSFVERSRIQRELERRIFGHAHTHYYAHTVSTVVQGGQGAGKSHLIAHLIHHPRIRSEFGLRLWFHAENLTLLQQQYAILARELNVVDERTAPEEILPKLDAYLATYPKREGEPWLIVYDGVTDVAGLTPFLPRAGGQIITVTRNADAAGHAALRLDTLTPEEGTALVNKLLIGRGPDAVRLSLECCHHPLVIKKACAYICNHQVSIPSYISTLRAYPEILDLDEHFFGKKISGPITRIRDQRRFAWLEKLSMNVLSGTFEFLENCDRAAAARTSFIFARTMALGSHALHLNSDQLERLVFSSFRMKKRAWTLGRFLDFLASEPSYVKKYSGTLLTKLSKVQVLTLTDDTFAIMHIFHLVYGKLKVLNLHVSGMITDANLINLSRTCPNLQSLNCSKCDKITDRGVSLLNFPLLTHLELEEFLNITDLSIGTLSRNFPKLQFLNLKNCKGITDRGVTHLILPQLTSLNLAGCKEITDASLEALSHQCPKLQTLDISGCSKVIEPGITRLILPQLTSLNLAGCKEITDAGLGALSHLCPRLQRLDISGCSKVTDRGITRLMLLMLTSVELECNNMTDASLRALSRNCPKLQRLINHRDCEKITDLGVSSLILPQLAELDLRGCKMTDASLGALSINCPKLQKLRIPGCENISDRGISQLVLPKLEELDLSECNMITNTSLSALSGNCPKLHTLSLRRCVNITDPELLNLPLLKHLHVKSPRLIQLQHSAIGELHWEGFL